MRIEGFVNNHIGQGFLFDLLVPFKATILVKSYIFVMQWCSTKGAAQYVCHRGL